MQWLKELAHSLGSILRRSHKEQELSEELQFHLERQIEQNLAAGMPPEEARYAALRLFGGVQQITEECRDMRRVNYIENFLQDVRYGLRQLRRSPGFTAAAVLTLALGIGANTAIFSLTYAVILRSLPVPNPEELVRYTFREEGVPDLSLSGPAYDALRKHETVNRDILAWSGADLAVQENGTVARVGGALMTGNGFRVLELRPYMGRVFGDYRLAAEDEWGTRLSLAVRSASASIGADGVRKAVRQVVPSAVPPTIYTFNELVEMHLRQERMLMSLSLCFGGIALLLSALGLYGVLARSVTLRTKEIGVRLALGARQRDAVDLVIRQALRLVLSGVGIGLLVAVGVTRLLRSLLFGVQPDSPLTLAAAAALLIVVALFASYLPARRAASVNPMVALRYE